MSNEIPVTAILLTLNEEPRIEGALRSIRPYVDKILVANDMSTIDNTARVAERLADKVIGVINRGNFADMKNEAATIAREVFDPFEWILWMDADERFDAAFLKAIQVALKSAKAADKPPICFRFPRINLPGGKNYPDYQIRLSENSPDIEWRNAVHEILYYIPANMVLSDADSVEGIKRSVVTLDRFPMIHFPRRTDIKREWW